MTGSSLKNEKGQRQADEMLKEKATGDSLHSQNSSGPKVYMCSLYEMWAKEMKAMAWSHIGCPRGSPAEANSPQQQEAGGPEASKE